MLDGSLASRLEGKHVGKWHVIKKRQRTKEDSSGYFSSCYKVKDNKGNLAFLKAYNYTYAFQKIGDSAGCPTPGQSGSGLPHWHFYKGIPPPLEAGDGAPNF